MSLVSLPTSSAVSAAAPQGEVTQSLAERLGVLEVHYFGHGFSTENEERRLRRL